MVSLLKEKFGTDYIVYPSPMLLTWIMVYTLANKNNWCVWMGNGELRFYRLLTHQYGVDMVACAVEWDTNQVDVVVDNVRKFLVNEEK